jgi:hypothetical protein
MCGVERGPGGAIQLEVSPRAITFLINHGFGGASVRPGGAIQLEVSPRAIKLGALRERIVCHRSICAQPKRKTLGRGAGHELVYFCSEHIEDAEASRGARV